MTANGAMSADESDASDSSSSSEQEILLLTRAKRSTAGNRLSQLLQHLDDDDVKADLLADDENDQVDYVASDGEDGDIISGSSDDSEDDNKGEADAELAGERELKKQERKESKRKRTARELVRVQPARKRVKIADDVTEELQAKVIPRVPKRPTLIHGPGIRHSLRTQTIANALLTEERVKQNAKKAERAQEVMRMATQKKIAEASPKLTQADRIARALEIEKGNSKSLNKWEKSERERLRIQQEKLEALRNRRIAGPFIRSWSGPVNWIWRQGPEGPLYARFKYVRDIEPVISSEEIESSNSQGHAVVIDAADLKIVDEPEKSALLPQAENINPTDSEFGRRAEADADMMEVDTTQHNTQDVVKSKDVEQAAESIVAQQTFSLDETHILTSATHPVISHPSTENVASTDSVHEEKKESPSAEETDSKIIIPLPSMPPFHHIPQYPLPELTPEPYANLPLLSERATRMLLILDQFPELDAASPINAKRNTVLTTAHSADPQISQILLPEAALMNFSNEEKRYLTSKSRRGPVGNSTNTSASISTLPMPPARPICAISGRPARFRDPKTKLPYADMAASKAIQRALANGCQWSVIFDVWTGIVGEGILGRVAKGVPEGFWSGVVMVKDETTTKNVIEV